MRAAENLNEFSDISYIKKTMLHQLQCFFNQKNIEDRRLEIEIEDIDIISWLRIQNYNEKVYWQNRDRTLIAAGVGVADFLKAKRLSDCHFANVNSLPANMRFYGGMRFNVNSVVGTPWEKFGEIAFFIPQFEICKKNAKTFFAVNIIVKEEMNHARLYESIVEELNSLDFSLPPTPRFEDFYRERVNVPNFEEWQEQFAEIQRQFSTKEIQKIVLSRRSTLKFPKYVDGFCLLQHLTNTQANTYNFYLQWHKDCAFVGATPERLYYRKDNRIFSEAVAGTRRRGQDAIKDKELGDDLLSSTKDIREHQLVVENIKQVFDKICKNYSCPSSPVLMRLKNLQHLYTSFEGVLNEKTIDGDILQLLHPTAAVCGLPKQKNMDEIEKLESFDRGWFAGPIGWLEKDCAEFAVAIRSCVVQKNTLYLFAGAGIVKSSCVKKEWNEIEDKMKNFDCIFRKVTE
ncbi:isochorismate synthase [Candidatus Uabimicrobium amorphum]|uniref:isochorismate synthase n=1 Tax=Uabimicrobium amorphum TaxID=2596890 RepID=A0A5S9IP40_UABAM|nr:isochorismate synthase [Candidatus Uabimicrobium amorphum]BBM85459.1 isochorismate synthase [Candidatus Uabimicrobium amorphum]